MTNVLIPERICGVIGWPLGHSLSPLLHNWAFQRLGLDYAYMAWPTPPERLEEVVRAVRALPVWGLSVTLPHKVRLMELADDVSAEARAAHAANTLYWSKGRLVADNTDVRGFAAPLTAAPPASALVLGAGGAARAAVAGLRELGVRQVSVTARDPAKAKTLADDFHLRPVAWDTRTTTEAELLVNATPLGMQGELQALSPWPEDGFTPNQIAYDLVYIPRETVFLRHAKAAGCATIGGLDMSLGQAAAQFRLWTRQELPVEGPDGARALLESTLD